MFSQTSFYRKKCKDFPSGKIPFQSQLNRHYGNDRGRFFSVYVAEFQQVLAH